MDPTIYRKPKNKISAANIIFAALAIAGIGFGVYGMLGANKPAQTENFKVQIVNNDGVVTQIETDKIEQKDNDKTITITDSAVIVDQTTLLLNQLNEELAQKDSEVISYKLESHRSNGNTYELITVGIAPKGEAVGGYARMYYRIGANSEWHFGDEGQGVNTCENIEKDEDFVNILREFHIAYCVNDAGETIQF